MSLPTDASLTRPPPRPFRPTDAPSAPSDEATDPTPSPIYTLLPVPSNSSSSASNTSAPCSRRPLRLGPARLHKKPSPSSASEAPAVAAVAIAAAAAGTPTSDGPRDYASLIPPAPGVTPRPEPNLAEMGYYQTTYWSCATRGTSSHCGWHRPIMVAPANAAVNAAAAAAPTNFGLGAAAVAGLVGILIAG
ncbi:hypothetical protein COL26b_011653 [Colletotrichum chrysophilum]|uniref:uncharacterized protein n=1 Tax=Colletotrichum chrysophilum TaxID=1836956 RepID=UPI0023012EF1|nr:uncharacterized protein COL26b_011653 [Colletotrichum chrysophilum]KAJ0366430.1 hypothetical protein COL26b_011653 [Colletotrichum chrysophilum]